jgi:hypothetical protein
MSLIFEDVVRNMNIASMSGEANLGAVQSVNEEIIGACNDDNTIAGRAAVSGSLDDVSGVFTLTANFNNYCEYEQGLGVTINGVAILSGTLDPATLDNDFPDFFNYTFTFTTLSLDYLGTDEGITMNGTFGANWVSSPMLVTMSFILKDNASLATYWFKDVRISLAEGVGYTDITNMTGRYYEPVYGYVDISIDNPIHMNDIDNWPSSGSFIVTGTENSKARLTYVNATQFQVVADTDGDGLYDDYSSGNLLWADY